MVYFETAGDSTFNQLSKIYIGGVTKNGALVGGSGFNGIIGGELSCRYAFKNMKLWL